MPIFLTLGQVTFANFEIPERINFGGTQSLSVKQLVGGLRVIDSMGRIDDDITWSGLFFGSTATFRAQFLDGMRVAGQQLNLNYSQFNYNVVIKDFKASFERFYQIPYTITVTVVQDLNKPFPVLVPVAYNDVIINAQVEANDLAQAINNPSIINQLAVVSAAINSVPSLSNATAAQIASIVQPLNTLEQTTAGAISTLSSSIFPDTLLGAPPPTFEANNILAADLLQLSDLYQLQAVLVRMNRNLLLINSTSNGQVITVNNANLFQLASQYYGDATKWTAIAIANNLNDPQIQGTGAVTLVIPNTAVDTGGILNN